MLDRNEALSRLRDHMSVIADLDAAAAVLRWDQQTHMPPGGVVGRAEQLATLDRISHEMLSSDDTASLLAAAGEASGEPEPGSDTEAVLRLVHREHERATKLPSRLVSDLSRATAIAEPAWKQAHDDSDYPSFRPHLERIVALQREAVEHLGYEDHPYDALLDIYEPGARKARLEDMFDGLLRGAAELVRAAADHADEDREAPLRGAFDERKQEEFGKVVASAFGYDWERGRQDRAAHPFCISFSGPGDVRMTTRYDPSWLSPALFATMHETGHALYEQGVDPSYSRSPISGGVSLGVHESQSRLWENVIGRSLAFWTHFYPRLQEVFPEPLGGMDLETFYRAINASRPSEIRVEADELTYNLHVALRFELEVALIEDSLEVADLPEAWNAKMEEHLGVTPRNDARGVLQDSHWSAGLFGYFPTYTIGNVLSVQIYDAALEAHPRIPDEVSRGEFGTLLGWLRENIHRFGKRYEPDDLIERSTGRPMEAGPYLRYLQEKFGGLYGL